MKEYKKSDLIKIVLESKLEVGEMADYKQQQGLAKGWEPVMSEPQTSKGYEGSYLARGSELRKGTATGQHIGHKVFNKDTGEEVVILYPCQRDIEEFKNTHKDVMDALTQKFGKVFITTANTIPTCEPRRTATSGMQVIEPQSGEGAHIGRKVDFASEISDTKYLKTYLLYPYIKEYLANQVNEHLEKCSIPRIKVNERSHLDNHSKFKNDVFTYQTLNFNSYRSVKDFFQSAVRKVQGGESPEEKEYREHHLGRQFNKVYTKWSKTTKSESKWYGLTDIYNLEKYGGSLTTFDTCVTSLLTIEGNLIRSMVPKFAISISFKSEHGKNIRDNNQLERMKLNEDYNKNVEGEVEIDDTDLSQKDAIANNESIRELLKNLLTQMKDEILSIPVQDQLVRAKISRFELSPEEREEAKRRRAERRALMAQNVQGAEGQPQGEEQPQEVDEDGLLGESIVQEVLKRIKI